MWASCNILSELGEITEFHTVFNANFAVKGVLRTMSQYNLYNYYLMKTPNRWECIVSCN